MVPITPLEPKYYRNSSEEPVILLEPKVDRKSQEKLMNPLEPKREDEDADNPFALSENMEQIEVSDDEYSMCDIRRIGTGASCSTTLAVCGAPCSRLQSTLVICFGHSCI